MEILAEMTVSDGRILADAVGTVDCRILTVGRRGQFAIGIEPDGRQSPAITDLPTFNIRPSVVEYNGRFMVWSAEPPFIGLIDSIGGPVRELAVPQHVWGGAQVGPSTGVVAGEFFMVPLGAEPPRADLDPWVPAPLAIRVDLSEGVTAEIGSLPEVTGQFLTWRWGRSVPGVVGDSLFVANLQTGAVSVYDIKDGDEAVAREYQLPAYLATPKPKEEVWVAEWIQIGGQFQLFLDVPQVHVAAFDGSGRLYAVRNLAAKWQKRANAYTETQGIWQVTRRSLEVYDRDGALVSAYRLPNAPREWLDWGWISVDVHGRIMTPDSAGSVLVLGGPFAERAACADFPRTLEIEPPAKNGASIPGNVR